MLTSSEIQNVSTLALCGMLVAATVTDSRQHRIPNSLVVLVLLVGLIANVAVDPIAGTIDWAAGLLIGFAIFLPFYMGSGMGAGDIKLMAAVAAFLAPAAGAVATGSALIAGLPLALVIVAFRRVQARKYSAAAATGDSAAATTGDYLRFRHDAPGSKKTVKGKTKRIPYAAAIATGAMIALWWSGRFDQLAGALML
jgi:prepilin peptidase CpaA